MRITIPATTPLTLATALFLVAGSGNALGAINCSNSVTTGDGSTTYEVTASNCGALRQNAEINLSEGVKITTTTDGSNQIAVATGHESGGTVYAGDTSGGSVSGSSSLDPATDSDLKGAISSDGTVSSSFGSGSG
jgi:hypothetical protein